MYWISIAIYFAPLLLTYLLTRDVKPKAVRFGLRMFFGTAGYMAVVVFLAKSGTVSAETANVLVFVFNGYFAFAVFPFIFIGAGLALGGWAKSLKVRERPALSHTLLAAALILPLISVMILNSKFNGVKDLRQAERDNYQSLTVMDKLGEHVINVPISPQLELRHDCIRPDIEESVFQGCRDGKYDKNYRLSDFVDRQPTAPALKSFKIFFTAEKCKNYNCAKQTVVNAWCDRRPELLQGVWCTNRLKSELRYQRYYAPSDFSLKFEKENWSPVAGVPGSQDFKGSLVQIKCNVRRDEVVAETQKKSNKSNTKSSSRSCRIKYRIEADIEVDSTFKVATPETPIPQAQEAFVTAQAFWQDMKNRE